MLITDMAVFSFDKNNNGKMTLLEIAEDTNIEAVRSATGAKFEVASNIKTF